MKHILWITATLALAFAGDRLGGFLLNKITEGSGFRYARLYNGQAEADILLVGNSRGLTFYQPHIEAVTQQSTFNVSYNGMPMNLAEALVQDYLAVYRAPKLAIIDVTICDRQNQSLINGFAAYIPQSPRLDSLIKVGDKTAGNANQISWLYRYNNEVADRTLYYRGGRSDEDWLLDRAISDQMVADCAGQEPYTITLDTAMAVSLHYTVKELQKRGTQVKLVINPYYPGFAAKITNMPAYKAGIEALVGLPVEDYSTAIAGREYFGDYQHLNKAGSIKFLDKLLSDMQTSISAN